MKKKAVAKPAGRNKLSVGATVAATLPLALATILPAALNRSPGPAAESKSTTSKKAAPIAFKLGCRLPFDGIKQQGLEVDSLCTTDGNGGDDTAKRLENNAKNNFCAEGDVTAITYEDFKNLQMTSDKAPDLKNALKTSRDRLSAIFSSAGRPSLGEGSLVQFVAFVFDAHPSNVGKGKGENVNCKLPTKDDNDIHIELMMDQTEDDPCKGVTAEMSPHFRPEAWNELVSLKIERPVRITGPLFFDNSHQPCHDGVRPNPKRISVWEIHPIYQFEVCKDKTLVACDVSKDSQWIPLDQWDSGDDEVEP